MSRISFSVYGSKIREGEELRVMMVMVLLDYWRQQRSVVLWCFPDSQLTYRFR